MAKVKVYRFMRNDIGATSPGVSPRFGTLKAIDALHRCVPLMDSEREVDSALLVDGFITAQALDAAEPR